VRTCRVEPKALSIVEEWVARRRASWERQLDRLGDYLAKTKDQPENGSDT